MTSLILSTATRYLMPLLVLFSIYLLMHGHNLPGGGFVGGLVAAAAFSLYCFAMGVEEARKAVRVEPRSFIAVGLAVALGSGLLPVLVGEAFMSGLWTPFALPLVGKLGIPQAFDTGVYLVVLGITLTIIFTLAEE